MKANKTYQYGRFWAYKSVLPADLHHPKTTFHDFSLRNVFLLTFRNYRLVNLLVFRNLYVYSAFAKPGDRHWFRWSAMRQKR